MFDTVWCNRLDCNSLILHLSCNLHRQACRLTPLVFIIQSQWKNSRWWRNGELHTEAKLHSDETMKCHLEGTRGKWGAMKRFSFPETLSLSPAVAAHEKTTHLWHITYFLAYLHGGKYVSFKSLTHPRLICFKSVPTDLLVMILLFLANFFYLRYIVYPDLFIIYLPLSFGWIWWNLLHYQKNGTRICKVVFTPAALTRV